MYNAGALVQRETGLAMSSTDITKEGNQSEYARKHTYIVDITAPSSLVGGIAKIQFYDPLAAAWITAPQKCYMLSFSGTAPSAVVNNTAGAAQIAGAHAENLSGLTNITDATKFILVAEGLGMKSRLLLDATSGTATAAYAFLGPRNYT